MFNPLDPLQVIVAREKFKAERVDKSRLPAEQALRAYYGTNFGTPIAPTEPARRLLVGGDQRTDRNAVARIVADVAEKNKQTRGTTADATAGVLKRDVQTLLANSATPSDDSLLATVEKLDNAVNPLRTFTGDEEFVQSVDEPERNAITRAISVGITDLQVLVNPPLTGLMVGQSAKSFGKPALQEALNRLTSIYQTIEKYRSISDVLRGYLRDVIRRIQGQIITSNLTSNPAVGVYTPTETAANVGRPTQPPGLAYGSVPGFPGGGSGGMGMLMPPGRSMNAMNFVPMGGPSGRVSDVVQRGVLSNVLDALPGYNAYNQFAGVINALGDVTGSGAFIPYLVPGSTREAAGAAAVRKQKRVNNGATTETAETVPGGAAPTAGPGPDTPLDAAGLAGHKSLSTMDTGKAQANAQGQVLALHPTTKIGQKLQAEAEVTNQAMNAVKAATTNNPGVVTLAAVAAAKPATRAEIAQNMVAQGEDPAVASAAAGLVSALNTVGTAVEGISAAAQRVFKKIPAAAAPRGNSRPGTAASKASGRSTKSFATARGEASENDADNEAVQYAGLPGRKRQKGRGYYGFEPKYDFNTNGPAWRNQMPATALGQQPLTPPHSMVQPYTGLIGRTPGKVDKYKPSEEQLQVAKKSRPTGIPIVDDIPFDIEEQEDEAKRASDMDDEDDSPRTIAMKQKKPMMNVGDAADKVRARQARSQISGKRAKMLSSIKASLGRSID